MKKTLIPFVLLLLSACSGSIKDTTIRALTLPSTPQAGDDIHLQYAGDSSQLAEGKVEDITLYYTVNDHIYARSISFPDAQTSFNTSFILPDSTEAFALVFEGDASLAHQKDSYVFSAYHADQPVKGAWAGESLFYHGLGNYLLGASANADTALILIKKEWAAHPKEKSQWMKSYLNTLWEAKQSAAVGTIRRTLDTLLSKDDLHEGDYSDAVNLFNKMGLHRSADSIKKIVLDKYPTGSLAQIKRFKLFNSRSDLDSMLSDYQRFNDDFGASADRQLSDAMNAKLAQAFHQQDNKEKVIHYAHLINNPVQQATLLNRIAWPLAQKGQQLDWADTLSAQSLHLIQDAERQPGKEKPTYLTDKDWKKKMETQYLSFSDTYALILFKKGNPQKATAYQSKVVKAAQGKNLDEDTRLIKYLVAEEDYQTAQSQLEGFYAQGRTSPQLEDYLKEVYTHIHDSDKGYSTYLSELNARAKTAMKKKLTRQMIHTPATDFTIPDLKGKEIALSALKGKVVIVDFWATWCGPCKASFPGMKKAVNTFKDDSDVVFLFINTSEYSKPDERHKAVADFIHSHDYPFHVLLDQRNEKDGHYQVISNYEVSGIPTKFIIGPEGNIRFKKVGFGGNTAGEAQEISMMINLARTGA